ncbi:MAG: hypothetical protein MUO92_02180 [Dehalococcoidales bacterium]|nr:hypothetical protein [Dehalococcoidales bacterium]
MVCTTLTVSTPTLIPVVTIEPGTLGFALNNSYVENCTPLIADVNGNLMFILKTVVQNTTAQYRITINWLKDGISNSVNALTIGNIGENTNQLLTTIPYAIGNYTGLTATISEVTAY